MGKYADITVNHWAADGGLLDNQPLDLVLERIFDRRARRRVRRALLFVVPTTGPAATVPPADPAQSPGLLNGLLADLSAVTGQSISQSLRAILSHNQDVKSRTQLRTNLADLSTGLSNRLLTPRLLSDYCNSEAERQARPLTVAMVHMAGTTTANHRSLESLWRTAIRDALTQRWLGPTDSPLPADSATFARFGQAAYDNGKSVALELLNTLYDAVTDSAARAPLIHAMAAVHGVADRPSRPDPSDLTTATLAGTDALASAAPADAAARVAAAWADQTAVSEEAWSQLADTLVQAQPSLAAIVDRLPAEDTSELAVLARYLGLTEPAATSVELAQRLFDLAVAEKAMLACNPTPYQRVQLVQLSADQPCAIAPHFTGAAAKLTGMQFHHFGAFYKRSWRANDWMWGRLDACARLVQLLLEPQRLRSLAAARPADTKAADWLIAQLAQLGPAPMTGPDGQAGVRTELAFLDDPSIAPPPSLPVTAAWLATAWQRGIVADELPQLARAVVGTPAQPADWSPAASVTWARKVLEPATDLISLLAACPVPKETFATEVGSPLFVRTLAKVAATTTGVLASVAQVPAQVRPALTAARTIAVGGYRLTNASGARPRAMVGLGLVALVIGVLLSLQSSVLFGLSGLGIAAVGGYVLAFGVWQLSRPLLSALAGITVLLALFGLASGWGRRALFGSQNKAGWVGRQAYMLGENAWYPVAAVLVIVLVGAALSAALRWASTNSRRKRADNSVTSATKH